MRLEDQRERRVRTGVLESVGGLVGPTVMAETQENSARSSPEGGLSAWDPQARSELFKLFLVFKERFQFLKNVVKKKSDLVNVLITCLHAFFPLS